MMLPKATTPNLSPERLKELTHRRDMYDYSTKLPFAKEHNGFRKGSVHLIVAATGAGKSTLRNTILTDILSCNKKISPYIYLSEESYEDFDISSARNKVIYDNAQRIKVFSEVDDSAMGRDINKNREEFAQMFVNSNCDILIFDNLTTSSKIYGSKFEDQESFSGFIKQLTVGLNVPTICFAHTKSELMNPNLVSFGVDGVRGSKTIANTAQYGYVISSVENVKKGATARYTFLKVDKARGYRVKSKLFYLVYDDDLKAYSNMQAIDFEDYKNRYSERDRLDAKRQTD